MAFHVLAPQNLPEKRSIPYVSVYKLYFHKLSAYIEVGVFETQNGKMALWLA